MANTKPIIRRGYRPWKTLRRRKIPQAAIAKSTEWAMVSSGCEPVTFVVAAVDSDCSTNEPQKSARQVVFADIVDQTESSVAKDIINIHAVDIQIVIWPTDIVATCESDLANFEALVSTHVRWGLFKAHRGAFTVPQTVGEKIYWHPWDNMFLSNPTLKLIDWGENIQIPRTSTHNFVAPPCQNVFPAMFDENGTAATFPDGAWDVTHHGVAPTRIHLKQRFGIPLQCKQGEGLSLVMGMKSYFNSTMRSFIYTSFGRLKVSFS